MHKPGIYSSAVNICQEEFIYAPKHARIYQWKPDSSNETHAINQQQLLELRERLCAWREREVKRDRLYLAYCWNFRPLPTWWQLSAAQQIVRKGLHENHGRDRIRMVSWMSFPAVFNNGRGQALSRPSTWFSTHFLNTPTSTPYTTNKHTLKINPVDQSINRPGYWNTLPHSLAAS